jgi:DNA-binding ferritin-like protein (Dps family)
MYPRAEAGSSNKQVDRRARGLPADYKKKLAAIDRQYYHTAVGATGPLVQRLKSLAELLCLMVGAFGEVSEDLEMA